MLLECFSIPAAAPPLPSTIYKLSKKTVIYLIRLSLLSLLHIYELHNSRAFSRVVLLLTDFVILVVQMIQVVLTMIQAYLPSFTIR